MAIGGKMAVHSGLRLHATDMPAVMFAFGLATSSSYGY